MIDCLSVGTSEFLNQEIWQPILTRRQRFPGGGLEAHGSSRKPSWDWQIANCNVLTQSWSGSRWRMAQGSPDRVEVWNLNFRWWLVDVHYRLKLIQSHFTCLCVHRQMCLSEKRGLRWQDSAWQWVLRNPIKANAFWTSFDRFPLELPFRLELLI